MASITLQQSRFMLAASDGTSIFRITNLITATEGPPLALFVYDVPADTFSHVASASDIASYPEEINADYAFYRRPDALQDFTTIASAVEFADAVREQLQALALTYTQLETDFVGQHEYLFPEDEE